jgi:hypothetical protein
MTTNPPEVEAIGQPQAWFNLTPELVQQVMAQIADMPFDDFRTEERDIVYEQGHLRGFLDNIFAHLMAQHDPDRAYRTVGGFLAAHRILRTASQPRPLPIRTIGDADRIFGPKVPGSATQADEDQRFIDVFTERFESEYPFLVDVIMGFQHPASREGAGMLFYLYHEDLLPVESSELPDQLSDAATAPDLVQPAAG